MEEKNMIEEMLDEIKEINDEHKIHKLNDDLISLLHKYGVNNHSILCLIDENDSSKFYIDIEGK